ncbi:MAG: DnaA/Hda family protein [Thermoplasmata archaeon]|nr:DnaA/Hda family protein [Thermoplasmata archaeon]
MVMAASVHASGYDEQQGLIGFDSIHGADPDMASDLRIPEGIIVRTAKGGPDSLKGILSDLKQYSFTGYLKVTLEKSMMNSTGYIVVELGTPVMAIYEFEKSKPRELRRIYTGEKSLRFILEDSQDKESNIELHSRVPKEEFERRFPDAYIAGRVAPKPTPKARDEAKVKEEAEIDPYAEKIEQWRRKGYKVETLETAREQGVQEISKELTSFERDTNKLRQFETILNNFPILGLEPEIAEIRTKLNDCTRIAEIESDIEFLQEKIRRKIQKRKAEEDSIKQEMERKKRDEKASDVYDLILKYQTTPDGEEAVKGEKCPICGREMEDGQCGKCEKEQRFTRSFPPEMRFDNFVIGPGSKFSAATAVAVAENPGKAYNPLLIFGATGLGKTHLLSAIGNHILNKNRELAVLYAPADKLVDAVEHSATSDAIKKLREELNHAELLLVDDMQFLGASEQAQGEMVHIIDSLIDSGKQVVLASDRLPTAIPGFSDRLNARIQKGLTVDLLPPDESTRIKLVRVKAHEKKLKLSDEIVKYIAEKVTQNVREIESTLNKVVAFSTIMKMEIDMTLISDILKPLAPVQETRKEIMKEVNIQPGHCYLIEEEKPTYSNVLMERMMAENYRGLIITRMNPKRIRDAFVNDPRILWLTDKDSSMEKTVPPSLEMIIHKIQEFMSEEGNSMVVLDGIQYLISNTNFDSVLRFLRSIIDEVSESKCIFAVSISPETMKEQEISIMEREMEVLNLT